VLENEQIKIKNVQINIIIFLLDVGIKHEYLMLIYPEILACATERIDGLVCIYNSSGIDHTGPPHVFH